MKSKKYQSHKGLFITGTDTGVGKTVITGAIARALANDGMDVGVMKPIATGCMPRREGWVSQDAEFLAQVADVPEPLHIINPVSIPEPLAPSVAARRANTSVDFDAIERAYSEICERHDVVLIEGIGGMLVPLSDDMLVADMAVSFGLPVIIVARPGLGTINHTLLTVEVCRTRGLDVAGVIINGFRADKAGIAEETNPEEISRASNVPVLAVVPWDDRTSLAGAQVGEAVLSAVAQIRLKRLLR
ncbi:MAG: dethiobiotin synthase [Phycisphaerae bacterium]|nr:dethiobiotin synthase [Phycisphaerae bacterium]